MGIDGIFLVDCEDSLMLGSLRIQRKFDLNGHGLLFNPEHLHRLNNITLSVIYKFEYTFNRLPIGRGQFTDTAVYLSIRTGRH